MTAPRDVHRRATRLLSVALVLLGLAMLATTVGAGGGPLSLGVLLGALFVAAGGARLWLERRAGEEG